MNYRILGKTGFKVSEVGLGTWQIGGGWGKVPEQEAEKILFAAHQNGVNFIDTADVYGGGRSEKLIGNFLRQIPGKVYVATKLGRMKGYPNSYSFELFRQCAEESLQRLQVEKIDLIQLHCIPKEYLQKGQVFDWLRRLRDEGLIRHFGASVETMEEALICLEQDDLTSLQIIFNIFRQKPINELFAKAKEKNVALVIRLPLASGLLSGKFTKETIFPKKDHRNFNRDGQAFNVGETFAGLEFEKGIELTEQLKMFVPSKMKMAQFALRWILDYEAVSVAIPGAKNDKQVSMNVSASNLPILSGELHSELANFYEQNVKEHIRGLY